MVPDLGKSSLTIGSDPLCDIELSERGVAPNHAKLEHEGGGTLTFVNGEAGTTTAGGKPMRAGERKRFDFRTIFQVGDAVVPFDHPMITKALMAQGQLEALPHHLVIGRDPQRVSILLQHRSVSAVHCTVALDEMTVIDNDSTSGTYIGGHRIAAHVATPLPPRGDIFLGPVPVPVSLLLELGGASPEPDSVPAIAPMSPVPAAARRHKTVFGNVSFEPVAGSGDVVPKTIGRTADNDIVIPHPQVSAEHAQVETLDGGTYISDRGSANGTYVRGKRLAPRQRIRIQSGEKIYIGPMPLQLVVDDAGVEVFNEAEGKERWAGRPLYEIEAWGLSLEVPHRDDSSKMKVLLDDISFKALPGDMIALMGPSGAGKTTLLLALNGYLPPTAGLVRINGEDLYAIYDTLRGSIGYVPQDDLVHPELTVFEAVRYSAKFRLPPDYSEEEIERRVWQTLRDLGLESVALLPIGSPAQKILSGGQRKRVNIALELVTDPVIIYLDEPTSGLAADDAASLVGLLHDLTRSTGKTLIMTIHQPAKEEYEKFSHALILGYGGVTMFFGKARGDSYEFFSNWAAKAGEAIHDIDELPVDNPRDMFALITERERPIFERLKLQDPSTQRAAARSQGALQWHADFYADDNPICQRMYSGRRAIGTVDGRHDVPQARIPPRGQFRLLLSRYFKTKIRDKMGTGILLAQAPIIGVLFAIVFGWQAEEVPAWCLGALQQISEKSGYEAEGGAFDSLSYTNDHTGALFFLVVAAMWFGTSNAAREIVKERSIYLRERMVNLGLFNYLMSKFVLLCLLCVVQCTVLLAIVFFALGFNGGAPAFAQELLALVVTSVSSIGLGLLLSALVKTSEAAMALTPIALLPQVILGGLMVPATTIKDIAPMMYLSPTRWGFEAAVTPERMAVSQDPAWLIQVGDADTTNAADFIFNGKFHCATAQLASDELNGAWAFTHYETTYMPYAALVGMTVVTLVAITVLLKRRDRI